MYRFILSEDFFYGGKENMDYAQESLKKHYEWKGKIETLNRCPTETMTDLSLAYTPGVAQPCLEIQKDVDKSYELTDPPLEYCSRRDRRYCRAGAG